MPGLGGAASPIDSNSMRAPSKPSHATLACILQYPRTLSPVPVQGRPTRGRMKCECGAGEEACPTDLRQPGAKVGAFSPDWDLAASEVAVHEAWVAAWSKLQPIDPAAAARLAACQMAVAVTPRLPREPTAEAARPRSRPWRTWSAMAGTAATGGCGAAAVSAAPATEEEERGQAGAVRLGRHRRGVPCPRTRRPRSQTPRPGSAPDT